MTLTGVCHCPRQIISNTARCIPILLPPHRAFSSSSSYSVCGSLVDRGKENSRNSAIVCVRECVSARVCRVSVCSCATQQLSRVRVVHAHNRFAAPRRFASHLLFRPDRRVFRLSLYSRSKGIQAVAVVASLDGKKMERILV